MLNVETQCDQLVALLRCVGEGDRVAFQQLHALTFKRLLPFARRIVSSKKAAEDVLQEAFIAIWRDATRFDSARAAPMTWMITIVRNKAIDSVRANALRERLTDYVAPETALAGLDPAAGPCEAAELAQRSRQIRLGLATLSVLPRQAIELAFYHDMTHSEVATEMTIALGTVKTWIRRGCQQMRVQLERPGAVSVATSRAPAC
ncbi:MAG: sigma-70 family RNA polymerase sigma factor [Telluria sp.]